MLDERTLGFAALRGNRQYITLGNVMADDRVALFLMDYPRRMRLKLFMRAKARTLADAPALARRLAHASFEGKVERCVLLHLEAFDWNCPQYITPRFSAAELDKATAALHARVVHLEAENNALRVRLSQRSDAAPSAS